MNKSTYTLLLIIFPFIVFSQTNRRLTLQEAISLGIKNSRQIQLDSTKKLIAVARQKQLSANQYPAVKASASYSRLSNVPEYIFPGQKVSIFPNIPNQYTAGVRLIQPIFGGFRAKSALESGQLLELAVSADAESNKEDVIFNIIAAYNNFYKQLAAKKLIEENLRVANSRLTDVKNFEKNGIVARNDVMRSELQVSNIELSKIDADNGLNITNFNLNILLGLPDQTIIDIDSASIFTSATAKTYQEFLNDAYATRADLKAVALRSKAAEKNIKVSKAGYFPVVSLQSGYLYANPNQRIVPPSATFHGTWDVSLGIIYDLSAIFTNKHQVAEARATFTQSQIMNEQLSDKIKIEVNTSYIQFLQNKERIGVSLKALSQAQENYRIVKNKYYNQVATLTDLLDADNLLLQSRLNLILNQADAELSYKNILKTTGKLSE